MLPLNKPFTTPTPRFVGWGWFLGYQTLLVLALVLATPVWVWALCARAKYRAGLWQKLGLKLPSWLRMPHLLPADTPRLWVHCVSVGEWNAARPLVALLAQRATVVVSVTTKTAYTLAVTQHPYVFYCPLDLAWPVAQYMQRIKPLALMVLETELWPALFFVARRCCPHGVMVVNARLSPRSYKGYQRLGPFMPWLLALPSVIYTQSPQDAERFAALGAPQAVPMGNIKFDVVLPSAMPVWQGLKLPHERLVVFASTREGEETLLLPVIQWLTQQPGLRVVLVPRHPERGTAVAALCQAAGVAVALHSQQPTLPLPNGTVLVVDAVGLLMQVYAQADLAIMGGSFVPWGGQNPLEPMACGVPVLVGPHMHNFAAMLLVLQAATALTQVASVQALQAQLQHWVLQPACFDVQVGNASQCLALAQGVSQRLANAVLAQVEL
jgi:3-deoxy-D-manno-octulosonic-acid transferase